MKTLNQVFEEDYLPDESMFSEDSDRLELLKKSLLSLSENERKIFLLYVENPSYSDMARVLGCSVTTARYYILRLKDKLMKFLEENEFETL